MQMARQYLAASGHHCPEKATIDDLTTGCTWVDRHLAEVKVPIRRDVDSKHRPSMDFSKRTRYAYAPENIHEYANGYKFREVLAQTRRTSLLQQFQSLGKEQREQLIALLSQQKN
jgi:hypothetical protein